MPALVRAEELVPGDLLQQPRDTQVTGAWPSIICEGTIARLERIYPNGSRNNGSRKASLVAVLTVTGVSITNSGHAVFPAFVGLLLVVAVAMVLWKYRNLVSR